MFKKREKINYGLVYSYIGIGVFMFFYLVPFLWTIITSLQPQSVLVSVPLRIDISKFSLQNYKYLFLNKQFILSMKNTFFVTVNTTFLSLIIASLGSYAVARFNFRGRAVFTFSCLSMQLAPGIAFLIPLFIIFQKVNLLDTNIGLVAVFLVFVAPVALWIMLGFFKNIPKELEEAAYIDGCSRFTAFYKIVLPLVLPGLIASGIVVFISVWGNLMIPLVISFSKAITLTVFSSTFAGFHNVDYSGAASAAVLSAIPTVLIALVFRKHFIKGLTEGGIKG